MPGILQTTFSKVPKVTVPIWDEYLYILAPLPINNTSILVQIMAWCRTGDKPHDGIIYWRRYASFSPSVNPGNLLVLEAHSQVGQGDIFTWGYSTNDAEWNHFCLLLTRTCFPGFGGASWCINTPRSNKNGPHSLRWHHNGRDGVSNHQPHDSLLNRLFRRRSKKTSKLRVTGLCAGNSPATGEFPAQMASNAENIFIGWRHHVYVLATQGAWVSKTMIVTMLDRHNSDPAR